MAEPSPLVYVATHDPYGRAGIEGLVEAAGLTISKADDAEVVVWDSAGALPMPTHRAVVALAIDEEGAQESLSGGARGALPRGTDGVRMGAAVRAVAAGLIIIDPAFSRLITPRRAARPESEGLTPREGEVLQLLAEGLSNKEIAGRLLVSEHTAKFHVNAILNKLGATTRTEAVVLGARWGLLML